VFEDGLGASHASPLIDCPVERKRESPNLAFELKELPTATMFPRKSTATERTSSCETPPPKTAQSVVPSAFTFQSTASFPPVGMSLDAPNVTGPAPNENPPATMLPAASVATLVK
jgi:hypothetical protein